MRSASGPSRHDDGLDRLAAARSSSGGRTGDSRRGLSRCVPSPPGTVASERIEFDGASGTYRTRFDFRGRSPLDALVEAVSVAVDTDPVNLPPLHAAVDCDALEGIFSPTASGSPRGAGSLTFDLAGTRVSLHSDGIIEVEPASR